MAYKPGDYYVQPSGIVMQWDGSVWQWRGQNLTPSGREAINNGTLVDPPGAATNPAILEATREAGASANGGTVAAPAPKDPSAYKVANATILDKNSGSIRYPDDIGVGGSDYMIFEFMDYVPPFSSKVALGKDAASYNAYNSSINALTKANGWPQIILYMPEGVSVSYKANWDGKKFGNIAAGVLSAAGGVAGGDAKKFFEALGQTASDTAKRAPAQIGAGAVSAIIGGITGDSVSSNDIFSSVGGQILNPNAELIFGGHDLRTFTFTYKLVPFNQAEAEIIFGKGGIITAFKKAMLPSFESGDFKSGTGEDFSMADKGKSDAIGFIKNPKLIQPYFMNGAGTHPYLPRLKPCTITDFDVNYTADGVYAAHVGGYPAAAEITINLTESKLVYSEDIDRGF
jgi:hypothetical protein